MALVFVSYSRRDSDFVLRLSGELRQRGVPLWLDQWAIPPGKHWDVVIENALEDSSHLLLVMTGASVKSANVRDEIDMAVSEGKTIIPIMLEQCRPPLRVRRLNYMDFTGPYEAALQLLLNALSGYGLPAPRPQMTDRQAMYYAFWNMLLLKARQRTQRHAGISPGRQSRIAASAGLRGLKYEYALGKRGASVALVINRDSRTENNALFNAVSQEKAAIEAAFGAPLMRDRLARHKLCRIKAVIDHDSPFDETVWADLQTVMIERMVMLEGALQPCLESLER